MLGRLNEEIGILQQSHGGDQGLNRLGSPVSRFGDILSIISSELVALLPSETPPGQ